MALSFCTSGQGPSGGGSINVSWGGDKGGKTTSQSAAPNKSSSGNTTSQQGPILGSGCMGCDSSCYGSYSGPSQQQLQAEAKAKAEAEKARKEAEKKAKIKESNEYYQKLMDILSGSGYIAKETTEEQAVQTAADTTLTNQASMLATGLNKSMAASLGSATLSSDAERAYIENISENEDAAYRDALAKVVTSLKARGDTKTAENLEQANTLTKGAQDAEDIANLINILGQGAKDIAGAIK